MRKQTTIVVIGSLRVKAIFFAFLNNFYTKFVFVTADFFSETNVFSEPLHLSINRSIKSQKKMLQHDTILC